MTERPMGDNLSYMNQRLRGAMLHAEMSAAALAHVVEVDPKSVGRWLSESRLPHPVTRAKVARVLEQTESYLWPEQVMEQATEDVRCLGMERLWLARRMISPEVWHSHFNGAQERIDILVYAGGFLIEVLDLFDVLRLKASAGVEVRILIGDPDSGAVQVRAQEEQMPWLAARCRTTARYLEPLSAQSNVAIRSHATTLYTSIFRADGAMLVNLHTYGQGAYSSPVERISAGALFEHYAKVFDCVWSSGMPRFADLVTPVGPPRTASKHFDQQ